MKKFYFYSISLLLVNSMTTAQTTYFQQDFSAGGVPANYVSATPGSGQFTDIRGSAGSGLAVSINGNALEYSRPNNAGDASFTRTTDFSPDPTSLYVQFSFEMVSSDPTQVNANAVIFFVGQAFGNGPTNPSNANTYAPFGINTTNTAGSYTFNSYPTGGSGEISRSFSGKQTLTFVLNHTGGNLTYITPAGGTEIQPNDVYDLWIGSAKVFDNKPVVSSGAKLTDFKMLFEKSITTIRFDDFLIRSINGTLPVNLVSFTAKPQGDRIQLSWETTAERNADRFEVQRGRDLGEFLTIGTVTARGTTDQRQYYGLLDERPLDGANYYRLKQVDLDGRTEYSKPISAVLDEQTPALELLGNPGDGQRLHIVARNLPDARYHLTTLTGQELNVSYQPQADGSLILIPAQPLHPGVYLLRAEAGATRLIRKIVVR